MIREITNDDLWAAIRGIGMWSMTDAELRALEAQHENDDLFAGRVIREAVRQVRVVRRGLR